MVAGNAPTPTGGAIASGTYHLTSAVLYTGPGGTAGPLAATIKSTVQVQGSVANLVQDATNKATQRLTQSFQVNGTVATWTPTCPATGKSTTTAYSATPTSLTMYIPNDLGQLVGFTYGP